MDRAEFLTALASVFTGAAVPSPSPTASTNPWDECMENPGLPYDRPLGLTMRLLDGPNFDLVKYRGRAVLLNIFATWWPPCNGEMPHVVEAAAATEPLRRCSRQANGFLYCDIRGGMGCAELRYRIEQLLAASAAALVTPSPSPPPAPL